MRLRKQTDTMNDEEILFTAQISDALAHPARLRIFRYIFLRNKERERVCNKDLVEAFDYAQATISQHVAALKRAGLIEVKKEERFSYYFVNIGTLGRYLRAVKKFE
ncbi:MAG: helix-turn-helix transcriptional regulator [Firmicutes bacterium]|nr:helix-turn-helix transcriptional regulator [Bacillota bacterium]